MEKQFVTYEIALKLKELGFNERCLAIYTYRNKCYEYTKHHYRNSSLQPGRCSLPLWQQAIDWFRNQHNLHIYIIPDGYFDSDAFRFRIDSKNKNIIIDRINTVYSFISELIIGYETAREQAILKAIELCKKN